MIKYAALFVIVALIVLSVFTFQFSKDSYKILPLENSDPAKVDLEKYNFQNWKEYHSPTEKFKVMLPTIPQQATENIKDPKTGENKNYDMYVSERLDGTIFMISLITFEKMPNHREAERLLGIMMDDMLRSNPSNKLDFKSFGIYHENPALDFAISNDNVNINAKTFMIGKTMYVLTRVSPSEQADPSEFNFFVNSFELSKQ
ncbi:putative uncharacterized protein [Waddlia chondrophila 2032/99]|uniref:Uncharacterized protein n=2 Tax=Waddlia chondrophila TaxID=71667 RepID=D6YWC8_WADCW|nr:hypothetical protein [Waddlia chondrophila]ADI38439.1 hypothetical protein wcw_1082 [Waddlia chondrophila WSU 86-1044]CCB91525.1 putative uncharacterized protein [Waddlia chondrophila 2032/99]